MSSIEKDERLLPLPGAGSLQMNRPQEVPAAYAPIYEDEVFGEGRSIRDYFLVIYKRLPIILGMTILVTAVVAFYMYRLPAVYEGMTTMVIQQPKPKATQSRQDVYINFGSDQNYINTQLRLLKNTELMQKVVLKLGLYKDPNLMAKNNRGFWTSLRSMIGGDKTNETGNQLAVLTQNTEGMEVADINTLTPEDKMRVETYAAQLIAVLDVSQVQQTDLVTLKMSGNTPELIPAVLNTLAETHREMEAERADRGGREVYNDLSTQIENLKADISRQEAERLAMMKAFDLPITSGDGKGSGGNFIDQKLSVVGSNFWAAQDALGKAQAEYDAAVIAANRGFPQAGITEKISDYKIKFRDLIDKRKSDLLDKLDKYNEKILVAEQELGTLQVKYTDEYPQVIAAKEKVEKFKKDKQRFEIEENKQIALLEKEAKEKIAEDERRLVTGAKGETLSALEGKVTAAKRRVNELARDYAIAKSESQNAGIDSTKLTSLNNYIETNTALLNTYLQKQKEIELTNNIERSDNINISTRAVKPEVPVGPARNRNILIAFLMTFAVGVGLAFLLDYLDDSVKTSDDIGKHLGLPTLALIPHQSILDKKRKGGSALQTINGSGPSSTALMAIENSRSAMAEAYRHLRTSLLFSSAGKPPATILVTSSQPSEGKTTTAINTAVTLAQAGADVVIIDCDLRRPRLHSHFGMDNTSGLTNYLSGERNLETLVKPYEAYPKLKVITSGPIPPNPAELLSSQDMKDLLRELKGKFKHIIVDSPPAISFTDAAILSMQVDGVVLVAMAGKSSIQLIKRFKQRLAAIGARLYGVVLNGIKPDSFEYGYYGYGYEYGYTYEASDDDSTPKMEGYDESIRR